MEPLFDQLARAAATPMPRRRVLALAATAFAGTFLAGVRPRSARAQVTCPPATRATCLPQNQSCPSGFMFMGGSAAGAFCGAPYCDPPLPSNCVGFCCPNDRPQFNVNVGPGHGAHCCPNTYVPRLVGSQVLCVPFGSPDTVCECPPERICGNDCCSEREICDPQLGCVECPAPRVICGKQCCQPGQVCGDPATSRCVCENPNDVVCGAQCCPQVRCCGSSCCPPNQFCNPLTGRCISCRRGETVCGSGGIPRCCKPSEVCINEQCCPRRRACLFTCCPRRQRCINGECRRR